MRNNSLCCLMLVLLAVVTAAAQVVPPDEIRESDLRALQQTYMGDLVQVGADIKRHAFAYPFYLSRKLDLDEQKQKGSDQHSIRFEHFNGQTVVAITGNYFASYSSALSKGQRAAASFLNVVVPILQATVPHFERNEAVQGFAVEISHHVRTQVIGMPVEEPENLMVYFPRSAAARLTVARNIEAEQTAVLDAQVYVNAEPLSLWLDKGLPQPVMPPPVVAHVPVPRVEQSGSPLDRANAQLLRAAVMTARPVHSVPTQPDTPPTIDLQTFAPPDREMSPEALDALKVSSQDVLDKIVKELDPQAHFVAYAPPAFVNFRHGVYLELSVTTSLPETARGSRYKLVALAFDEHIAHLLRSSSGYFKSALDFDGIAFSTTVHVPGSRDSENDNSVAAEFFFPFSALHCYENYDCTGQQLIDAGTVLINGERAGLDLLRAEAGTP